MAILTKLSGRGDTNLMISLIVHAVLGLATVWWIVASNRGVFAKPTGGGAFSPLELGY
jgi:hypothetical protein